MEHSRLKLIWDTNLIGILILAGSTLFQIWLSFCDQTSLTWQMMDSVRETTELTWRRIWVDLFAENKFLAHTLGTTVLQVSFWILLNSILFVVDIAGYPHWMFKYKIQEKKNNPVDRKRVFDVLKTGLFNLVVINLFFTAFFYPLNNWTGSLHTTGVLPTFGELVFQLFFGFRIIEEFGNYYSHRILHMPQFYKYHKKHHEWTAPIGIVTVYCGPVEHFFGNELPVAAGPFLFRSHLLVGWIWSLLVIFTATMEHSGYHIPFFCSAEGHDYHHKTFTSWYGTMAFLDVLHGTDRPFTDTINGKRQFISCSLTPVKDLVPETRAHKAD